MKKQIGLTLVAMLTIGVLGFAAASIFTQSVAAQRGNGQSLNGCGIVSNSGSATLAAQQQQAGLAQPGLVSVLSRTRNSIHGFASPA